MSFAYLRLRRYWSCHVLALQGTAKIFDAQYIHNNCVAHFVCRFSLCRRRRGLLKLSKITYNILAPSSVGFLIYVAEISFLFSNSVTKVGSGSDHTTVYFRLGIPSVYFEYTYNKVRLFLQFSFSRKAFRFCVKIRVQERNVGEFRHVWNPFHVVIKDENSLTGNVAPPPKNGLKLKR